MFLKKSHKLLSRPLSLSRTFSYPKNNKSYDESEYIFSNNLEFLEDLGTLNTFRVMDLDGKVVSPENDNVDYELLVKVYEKMISTEIIDDILLKAQRQGKISFYMTSFGETATIIGSAASLKDSDMIYP